MVNRKKIFRVFRQLVGTPEFRVLAVLAVCTFFIISVDRQNAGAGVGTANAGTLVYGDTTNAGTVKFQNLTYSDTFSAEMSGPAASASGIAHVVAKNAPTRDEVITGQLKVDGRLDVQTCTGGCDTAGEMTSLFNKTGISAALTCDATLGACPRPFDIAYEPLSGKALVAFSLNSVAGVLQYCFWDGSSLSPAGCTTPSTYAIDAPNCGTAATQSFARVKLFPYGEGLKDKRTNEMLVIINEGNGRIFALRWDGSSFGNCTLIAAATPSTSIQNFDGAWEGSSGNAMVVWAEGTSASTTPFQYKRWIRSNTTWDSSGTNLPAQSVNRIGHWVDLAGASQEGKNHIAIMTTSATAVGGTTGAGVPYIWDGTSMTKGNEWPDIEHTLNDLSSVAIEPLNAGVRALFVSSGGAASDDTSYETWIEGTGFSAVTDVTGAMADDAESHKLVSSPNRNDIYLLGTNIDDSLQSQRWSGTAWNAAFATREATIAPGPVSANTHGPEKGSYDMSIRPYSPWQRDWRFYSGTDTANTPTTALAAENTAPAGVNQGSSVRLRINYAERAALGSIDARKKLQYTTGCTPNTAGGELGCTWTDVGDAADSTIWRYKSSICASCTDGTLLAGTVLTGTNATCTAGNGCGTWVMDKDAAAGANMDHNASLVQESEWDIENNNATPSTTYYFRIYDVDQLTPQFREQDANDCGAGAAACTYPSLTTANITYEQSAFRFFENQDSAAVATALAAQDTTASLSSVGQAFRLRMLMHIGTGTLGQSYQQFKLQYAAKSGTCDVGFTGETYTDMTSVSQGPRNTTNSTDIVNDTSIGTLAWTSPGNAHTDDSIVTTAGALGATTNYLKASNFGFSIPSGATILGIVVEIEKDALDIFVNDNAVRIVKGGIVGTTDRSNASAWPNLASEYITHGSSSDLWGTTWTPADINSSGFGVALSATVGTGGNNDEANVDSIRMTVHYSVDPIHFSDNSTPTDNSALTNNGALDPTHGADTIVTETYEEANNFTNSVAAIPAAQDGKWDFSLKASSSAPSAVSYCFRVVKSDGSLLNTYSVIPEITTATLGPTMDQVMRGGNWFNSSGIEQDLYWAR